MSDMRLAIMGAAGRMGRVLTRMVHETPGLEVAGGSEMSGSDAVGQDIGELAGLGSLGVPVTDKLPDLFTKIDGVIDFTVPKASVEFVTLAAQARIVHVIGTTGFTDDQLERLDAASRHATLIKAGNMSLGVNLLTQITKRVAQVLNADFDIEIVEMHHRHKVDAPSGTALMLGEAAADGRGIVLDEHAQYVRKGHTGERQTNDIGFATLRGGSVVGDHTVVFAGNGERIELTHRASDRDIFARGAVTAALWGRDKSPGLYSMADVLGF